MPQVRFKALRRASLKKRPNEAQRLAALRALYIMVFNAEESLIPLAVELFHLIGYILEGVSPEELPFSRVSRIRFLETYKDLLSRDDNEEESEKDD